MLVVISDLHLTDGTSGDTISADAFQVFCDDLKVSVKNACFQKSDSTKKFIPIESCNVILNGDVLDVIRSQMWRKSDRLKPWSQPDSEEFINVVSNITDSILEFNKAALSHLKNLAEGIKFTSDAGDPVNIPVRLYYMVGNHDWFYHLPDSRLNPVRNKIIKTMGLSNPENLIIPHLPGELHDCMIEKLCLQHRVYIQHGDLHDEVNYVKAKGRNYSSLGDAVVVMLLNAFPEIVKEKLGLSEQDPLFIKLKEIDNVRPLFESPSWLFSTLKHHAGHQQRDQVVSIWKSCVASMMKQNFVKKSRKRLSLTGRIKFWFQFGLSRYIPLKMFVRLAEFASKLLPANEKTYFKGAENEPWLYAQGAETSKADYVTYGHTHAELLHAIDEVIEGEKIKDKVYLNSGTWRVVHNRTMKHKKQYEYTRYHVMTYLAFYNGKERGGRPYETWSGRLGIE